MLFQVKILLLLLSCMELSSSQYYQNGYGADPQFYGFQNYDLYPGSNAGYEGGFFAPSGYGSYGYSPQLQTRSADDPASDAAIKSAMVPLNSIVSSVPAQPLPISPVLALIDSDQRSATSGGNANQKKSNCTTGCSAAKSAAPEAKQAQMSQQTLSQSTQQVSQQSTQQNPGLGTLQGMQMCQCPCTQTYTAQYHYPYYMQQSYAPSPYSKSGSTYYTVAHRTRNPSRTQYRPYSYIRPSYYDPNYNRAYYASIRN